MPERVRSAASATQSCAIARSRLECHGRKPSRIRSFIDAAMSETCFPARPGYVVEADGKRRLYLLVHGWSAGKYAVRKHEPDGAPSVPRGWRYWAEDGLVTPRPAKK